MKKICVVTGTRAEYGLLYPIMKKIQASPKLDLQLIATTMHMSVEYGNTYAYIEADGFKIDECIENLLAANTNTAVCKSTGLAMGMLADAFKRLQPDMVMLLGDRFETHAAATTALLMNIPIAHIHGGEISEGAVDEQIRHAITKMSHLHFTATEQYRQRVIQMGEDPDNVIVSGAPGIDNIVNLTLMSKDSLEKNLNWCFGEKNILFTYHSETLLSEDEKREQIEMVLNQMAQLDSSYHVLFTYANADEGGALINQEIERFVAKDLQRYHVVKSLGQLRYLSVMKIVDVLVGNTSSGIVEAASFYKPVVNIGDREKGRIRSGNVLDCSASAVRETIDKALSDDFIQHCKRLDNVYGTGNAAEIILSFIENANIITNKKFRDI